MHAPNHSLPSQPKNDHNKCLSRHEPIKQKLREHQQRADHAPQRLPALLRLRNRRRVHKQAAALRHQPERAHQNHQRQRTLLSNPARQPRHLDDHPHLGHLHRSPHHSHRVPGLPPHHALQAEVNNSSEKPIILLILLFEN